MATITTRSGKGSPLTNSEVDSNFSNINTELGQKESASNKGVANGYASLDGSGKVPSAQLPSYVDDVVEGANLAALPATGETGKIYVTLDTNKTYRWSGSAYVEISASPGSTDAVTEGSTNLYFTNARARSAISASGSLSYNSSTGVLSYTAPTAVSQLSNDSGYITSSALSPYLTSATAASTYQTALVSGTSIKTVNGNSLLGSGNIQIDAGVSSFNTRTGAITLTSGDVTTALGFTPYNATNPSGYTNNTGTVTSVSGTGTVSGLTLTGTVTGSGSLTLGGTLSLTSGQVTTALGYTPYNSSNPSGYITSSSSITGNAGSATTAARSTIEDTRAAQRTPNAYDDYRASYEFTNQIVGSDWHTAFTMQGWHDGYAAWQIIGPASTSAHENFYLRSGINTTWNSARTILHSGNYTSYSAFSGLVTSSGNNGFANATYFGAVRNPIWSFGNASSYGISYYQGSAGRDGIDTITLHPNGSTTATGATFATNSNNAFVNNNVVLNAANYTSYSPSLTGSGASGAWSISTTSDFLHSDRDFPSGTLITTDINYAVSSGDPFVLEIRGNSYGNAVPLDIQYQGYIYSDTIISHGGVSNGLNISGLVAINNGGNLCFWFPSQGYWNGYYVKVYVPYSGRQRNRVTSISGSGKPTTAKEVGLSANIRQSLHSGNYTSYSPSLTGSGASGTWGISITGNAATAYGLDVHTGRNSDANKVVRTDGNGYIQAGWINTVSGNLGSGSRLNRVWCSDDQYMRYLSLAEFKMQMGLSAKNTFQRHVDYTADSNYWVGSFGGSGMGANETFHGGSGFIDLWGGTNFPPSTSHVMGFNALHYTTNSFGSTGGNAYGIQVVGQYDQGGLLFSRACSGGSFSAWRRQLDDNNYSSYALPLSGGTIAGNGVIDFGPNSSWSATLRVGGNGHGGSGRASVVTTNGNLHLDGGGAGTGLYLNYYVNGPIYATSSTHNVIHAGNYSSYALPLSGGTLSGILYSVGIQPTGVGGNSGVAGDNDYKWGYQEAGAWSHPYPDLILAYHTGMKFGANTGYGGMRFYADHPYRNPAELFSVGNGDSNVRVINTLYSYAYRGNGNVAGTGEATYHPAGIYSTSTNWLYGTMYRNGSNTYSSGGGIYSTNEIVCDHNYGRGLNGVYDSYRFQHVWMMGTAYQLAANGTTTGNAYGIAWSHPNAGGAAGNLTDHGMLIINNGGFRCAISNSIVASGNITAYSDERLKKNWRGMPDNFVERLAQVRVGCYERIDDGTQQVGVSAQSLQPLLPEAIQTAKDEIGTLSVSYGNAAMASAVELAKELVMLKRELAEIKSRLH